MAKSSATGRTPSAPPAPAPQTSPPDASAPPGSAPGPSAASAANRHRDDRQMFGEMYAKMYGPAAAPASAAHSSAPPASAPPMSTPQPCTPQPSTPAAGSPNPAAVVRTLRRPYFIPASVNFEALPEPVQRALVGIVGPAYEELVERAITAMERAAGNTMVFLLTMEVLHQCDVIGATEFNPQAGPEAAQQRDKLLEDHLRLVSAKQMSARFALRLSALREQPYTGTMRRLPVL